MLTNVSSELPPSTIVRLQQQMINAVLGGTHWLTVSEVRDISCADNAPVHRWLQEGRVFAIERDGHKEFPRYAFDSGGIPLPVLQEVLKEFGDTPPIRVASWFESTSATLNGKRLRELLTSAPDSVVAAARLHIQGPVHG